MTIDCLVALIVVAALVIFGWFVIRSQRKHEKMSWTDAVGEARKDWREGFEVFATVQLGLYVLMRVLLPGLWAFITGLVLFLLSTACGDTKLLRDLLCSIGQMLSDRTLQICSPQAGSAR